MKPLWGNNNFSNIWFSSLSPPHFLHYLNLCFLCVLHLFQHRHYLLLGIFFSVFLPLLCTLISMLITYPIILIYFSLKWPFISLVILQTFLLYSLYEVLLSVRNITLATFVILNILVSNIKKKHRKLVTLILIIYLY